MSFKCGIVGLPNVGKSTLFNALTNSSKAQAANFPFCTIDPNIGVVPVPDERLNNLANISKSKKTHYLLLIVLENKSNFFLIRSPIELFIFSVILSIPISSSSSKFCKT